MTEEQAAQFITELQKTNALLEGVGIVAGHIAWWVQVSTWVLLCCLFFVAIRWHRS